MGGFPKNRSHIYHTITPYLPQYLPPTKYSTLESTKYYTPPSTKYYILESTKYYPLESTKYYTPHLPSCYHPIKDPIQGNLGNGWLSKKPLLYFTPNIYTLYYTNIHNNTTHFTNALWRRAATIINPSPNSSLYMNSIHLT